MQSPIAPPTDRFLVMFIDLLASASFCRCCRVMGVLPRAAPSRRSIRINSEAQFLECSCPPSRRCNSSLRRSGAGSPTASAAVRSCSWVWPVPSSFNALFRIAPTGDCKATGSFLAWSCYSSRALVQALPAQPFPRHRQSSPIARPPERRSHGMALIGAAFGMGFTFGLPWQLFVLSLFRPSSAVRLPCLQPFLDCSGAGNQHHARNASGGRTAQAAQVVQPGRASSGSRNTHGWHAHPDFLPLDPGVCEL